MTQEEESFASNSISRTTNDDDDDDDDKGDDDDDDEVAVQQRGKENWESARLVANRFFAWSHLKDNENENDLRNSLDLAMMSRNDVHELFMAFLATTPYNSGKNNKNRLEATVMAALRRQKLFRSKRSRGGGDLVLCSFARLDGSFAPFVEQQTAREALLEQQRKLEQNKRGIEVATEPVIRIHHNNNDDDDHDEASETQKNGGTIVVPIKTRVSIQFPIHRNDNDIYAAAPTDLIRISVSGPHQRHFQLMATTPTPILTIEEKSNVVGSSSSSALDLEFQAPFSSVYRVAVTLIFQQKMEGQETQEFTILRSLLLRAGNSELYQLLQPKTPYVPKNQRKRREKPLKVVPAPEQASKKKKRKPRKPGDNNNKNKGFQLKAYKIPKDVKELVQNKELESTLVPPSYSTPPKDFSSTYRTFWQNLLWASELQALHDIQLYDMEHVQLQKHGRYFQLHVAGLAEKRPSVLKGDIVLCHWKNKQYKGRVMDVHLLNVFLEFHKSFHYNFNVQLDRIEWIRFTFTRTIFRTSHAGCIQAVSGSMGRRILMPTLRDKRTIQQKNARAKLRIVPEQLEWTSTTINQEQKDAVRQIVAGRLCPLPYVIFGPPGTGKTTTITQAVYQLARLHKYSKKQKKLKILLVAPSNDAADILVEKLSSYFPPSEMLRVLAYTRSINQVSAVARPYVREGLMEDDDDHERLIAAIQSVQITVTTVNLAARLSCMGLKKGSFDVLCVDEAGHATEPEVVAVAATLMQFSGVDTPGQLILAGDPRQLGPIITSDLCKKFGMDVSYMERLVEQSPAYRPIAEVQIDNNNKIKKVYPSELVTLLVQNYRSHPAILKLPNELFYDGQLQACGDVLTTHSMAKWEYLPAACKTKKFPIIFHSTDGENLREGNSPSWFNPQEAAVVVEYVGLLMKQSKPPLTAADIGVITPYHRQVQKITQALNANNLGGVKVGSVETFQGQERRCIIISTVRSETSQLVLEHDQKFNLGFVANEKRFNVAITRAKALLIVIGNPRVLATDKKNWLPFLNYCRDRQAWVGEEWQEDENEAGDVVVGGELLMASDNDGAPNVEDSWAIVTDTDAQGYINREE